jgi:hypothetical protein
VHQENIRVIFGVFISQTGIFDVFFFGKSIFHCLYLLDMHLWLRGLSLASFIHLRGLIHRTHLWEFVVRRKGLDTLLEP